MRTSSDRKPETEEVPTSREMFTAETVRTASHVMIAGNALLSAHLSPLLVSSFNSIFSTLATSITYGRTPQKIQQTRLEALKTLIENSRPLFATEMPIFFAKSASYQTLKKQFEMLDKKYSSRIESESKTFWYLMLAIGIMGAFYFVARLLQDSDDLNWVEIISVLGMIGMMSYSNVQSHRELVMQSRKDYQEFIHALINFQTQMFDEVPILKIIFDLEQMKKEMEECMRELNELGVETSEIREADEGGVEESKGAEKSLMQRVEERLQSLLKESTQEIERTNQRMCSELGSEISREKRDSIEKQAKERIQEIEHTYYRELEEILDTLKSLKKLQVTYNNGYETLQRFYEKFKRPEQTTLDAAEINALKRRFSLKKGHSTAGSSPESAEETISPATIEVGIRI